MNFLELLKESEIYYDPKCNVFFKVTRIENITAITDLDFKKSFVEFQAINIDSSGDFYASQCKMQADSPALLYLENASPQKLFELLQKFLTKRQESSES